MSLMLQEIEQQPEALERTYAREIRHAEHFRRSIGRRKPQLVVLVARGTSDNAARFLRYLLEIITGIPVSLAAPSVSTVYGSKVRWDGALVIGISQSGESTDTNHFLSEARQQGAATIAVANEARSTITTLADEVFLVRAGREKSVAATKTYTGQLMVGYLLAYALGAPIRTSALERLAPLAARVLKIRPKIEALVERYRYMTDAVVIGRGLNYANAFEFSLKLMETCYVVAERFSGADFLHGPIALVERAFPVFVFAPPGPTLAGTKQTVRRLSDLQAETLVITSPANKDLVNQATRSILIQPKIPVLQECPEDLLTPIPYIIPAQLFAALLAQQKGIDPDHPRTLSKVTKTL